jgi:hypothetical protein
MNKNSLYLVLALTEDLLLLLFLTLTTFASIEVLLPELVLSRIPLALLFGAFFATLTVYFSLSEKLRTPLMRVSLPKIGIVLLFVFLVLALGINLRAFGLWAALAQIILLVMLWFLITKKR